MVFKSYRSDVMILHYNNSHLLKKSQIRIRRKLNFPEHFLHFAGHLENRVQKILLFLRFVEYATTDSLIRQRQRYCFFHHIAFSQ